MTLSFFFWWWPGFEPLTLHILCIIPTNWAKLTRTFGHVFWYLQMTYVNYMMRMIVSWWCIYLEWHMACWDFLLFFLRIIYLVMKYYVFWLSSVANFYGNQVMHVLEKCRRSTKSLELLNLLHDYCFWGLECYSLLQSLMTFTWFVEVTLQLLWGILILRTLTFGWPFIRSSTIVF
jgi:hypothetical protein